MFDLFVSCLVLVLLCAGALVGRWLLGVLPETHRSQETMEFTRVASGLLVTFTALVLSLLITTIDTEFRKTDDDLRTFASMIIRLNSELNDFGKSTLPIRSVLRTYTASAIASTWPEELPPSGAYPKAVAHGTEFDSVALGDLLQGAETDIRRLDVNGPEQATIRTACLKHIDALLDQRLALVSEAHSSITPSFFIMMLFWLLIVFISFGMTAPRNGVAVAFIVMVGLSVSGAIFVILELDGPLDGLIKVSSDPMRHALAHIDLSIGQAGARSVSP